MGAAEATGEMKSVLDARSEPGEHAQKPRSMGFDRSELLL